MYPPEAPYRTYCSRCWWSDGWDPLQWGRDYDFSRPFFEQLNELWHEVPLLELSIDLNAAVNSPYNNHCGNLKNCYMLFHADFVEDSAYGVNVFKSKNLLDCALVISSDTLYDSMHCYKTSRSVGLRSQVTESIDCFFLKDCHNCQNCFASANLRGKKYYIFNRPYTKEDYFKEIRKWDLGSYKVYQEVKKLAEEHWNKLPPKPTMDELTVNCTGSHVFQSKNCKSCFEVVGAEDSKYLFLVNNPPIKDCYDVSSWGNNMNLIYECCIMGENSSNVKFSQEAGINLYNADYGKLSTGGSNHFGCVSVKKKDYCILNKQYPKKEYEELRSKIIKHMNEMPYIDKKGRVYKYGEFFPTELSPFAYNETIASNFFPLSRTEAEEKGFSWRESEKQEHQPTILPEELPDHIKDVDESIFKEIIGCSKCKRGFKIVPIELQFLKSKNLPLPRECPFCRIRHKFDLWVKNLRVFGRICSKCGAEFETNYPKEEVDYILCKKCYLQEVV